MPPQIATVAFVAVIVALFWLDRDGKARTSGALWVPVVWLCLNASRTLSQWLAIFGIGGLGTSMDSADQYLEGSPFDRSVYLVLTVVGMVILARRHRSIGRILRANGPILLFFFYCAVSVVWSEYPDVAFKRWFKALGDIVMVLIVLTDNDRLAAIRRVLTRVGLVLLPLSILFIKYYPALGREYGHFDGRGSFTGVTSSKNLLGMTILLFGLGPVWRLRQALSGTEGARRPRLLIAQGALLAMAIWLFAMADSATALSCFLMASGVIVATSLPKLGQKPAVVHLVVIAVVCVAVYAVFGGSLVGIVGRDSTLTGRTDIWNLVLGMKGNSLFGTGFESFWLGWRRERLWSVYRFHLNEAHNGYIEVYLNLGWIGISLLALLMVTGYRSAMSVLRRDSNSSSLRLAFFVAAVTYGLTEAAFRMMSPVWLFFLWAITSVPEAAVLKRSPQLSPQRSVNLTGQESPAGYAPLVG